MSMRSFNKMKTLIVMVLLIFVIAILTGCEYTRGDEWVVNMEKELKIGWEREYGEEPDSMKFLEYNKSMSESHRMMAAMILNNKGMDSDLDSYKEVYLCIVKIGDKEEAMVIVDGKPIYP